MVSARSRCGISSRQPDSKSPNAKPGQRRTLDAASRESASRPIFSGSVAQVNHQLDLISVVLPLYNEVAVLDRLYESIVEHLENCDIRLELIFVNDGSNDESGSTLDQLAARDQRVRVLHLSRNFGHQSAILAGLSHARGDAVIVMDSDLQDSPSSLPEFIRQWRNGHDVVYAVRVHRKENPIKRLLFYGFYRVLNIVSTTPIPNDAGNFGLVDRQVLKHIVDMNETERFYPGLRRWVGFRQIGIPVERGPRHDQRPRVSMMGLFRLAKTAVFSFSSTPLAMFYTISAVSLFVSISFGTFTLYHKLVTGLAIPGWTSTIVIASFFGALNALGIGILGENVVRIHDQVRGRPTYIVARYTNAAEAENDSRTPVKKLEKEVAGGPREGQGTFPTSHG